MQGAFHCGNANRRKKVPGSGNCFLLYAPEHFACYQYLRRNHAAYTVSGRHELEAVLRELVAHPAERKRYQAAALALAEKNHRAEKNSRKFQSILRGLTD